MRPLTSIEAMRILKAIAPGGCIFCVGVDDEEIRKVLAVQYAIDAIKERDDLYRQLDELLEKVKSWKEANK